MLRRGLSLLGGLFGGGGGGGQEFMGGPPATGPPGMQFRGNFSEPMQGPSVNRPRSKKEDKLAREYQKLGQFWVWRIADTEDKFQSFNIANQKLIRRKGENPEARNRIMLGKEKALKGDIMVDLNQFRGGCLTTSRGKNEFLPLDIKLETFDAVNNIYNIRP
ncbi:hypothetical protein BD770DRAFT_381053 [Pilaira anomala]|nr:hypothetical protein BD770DRAFT_381053 [Pilaira anomala]